MSARQVVGHVPWRVSAPGTALMRPRLLSAVPAQVETAPAVRDVTYRCSAGHVRVVRLAADAMVPGAWDCRVCSARAALHDSAGGMLDGLDDAPATPRDAKSHWDRVLERRTVAELEVLLAERLDLLRTRRGEPPASKG
jgi:hypothetical protein